jgi:hypothetical protein
MQWLLGLAVIAAGAVLLRRLLQWGAARKAQGGGRGPLRGDLPRIYNLLAQEIETRMTILGLTFKEACGEREANRQQMAWLTMGSAQRGWEDVTVLVAGLLSALDKSLGATSGIVSARRVAVERFKSRTVVDCVPLYKFLDEILLRSERRFALQLHFLLQALTLLSKDVKHSCCEGARTLDSSDELWTRLDYYFHDLDLIAKETLLALRTFLACQSPERAHELALDLHSVLERGRRVSVQPPASMSQDIL